MTRLRDDEFINGRPRWMKPALIAAGIYNLVWGAAVILFPAWLFNFSGIEPPRYPGIWQCVGMVVGVYGIGYLIAAGDPFRHWPIVLVGLLGKILGPIGFLMAATNGQLPWIWGVTIITNDFIWWLPMGAILYLAFRYHSDTSIGRQIEFEDALHIFTSQRGPSLYELSKDKPLLLVFLRHMGCTFCREALDDLARSRDGIEAADVNIALVHMSSPLSATLAMEQRGLGDVHRFADPSCEIYRAFGVGRGSAAQLLGPKVWIRGVQAALAGHGLGRLAGDGFRMPGVFLLRDGEIVATYRHNAACDRPDYLALAKLCGQTKSRQEGTATSPMIAKA